MRKVFPACVAIVAAICLNGCAFFHHPKQPKPMKTTYDRLPPNTIEPRFDAVSPTTQY